MNLKRLVGSGDKIGLMVLPFLVGGLIVNIAFPSHFVVGGPPPALAAISIVVLIVGVAIWAWSVVLILVNVPSGKLITSGPYALVKHPLYTAVALLILPWAGFLLNSWMGVLIGFVLYVADRLFAPEEEAQLSVTFGPRWEEYRKTVRMPWV